MLSFIYNPQKEVGNFEKVKEFLANRLGKQLDKSFKEKLRREKLNASSGRVQNAIKEAQKEWAKTKDVVFEEIKFFYEVKESDFKEIELIVYLTRAPIWNYSLEDKWFAAPLFAKSPQVRNKTVIHELNHFYFHKHWDKRLKDMGFEEKQIFSIKEVSANVFINQTPNMQGVLGGMYDKPHEEDRLLFEYLEAYPIATIGDLLVGAGDFYSVKVKV